MGAMPSRASSAQRLFERDDASVLSDFLRCCGREGSSTGITSPITRSDIELFLRQCEIPSSSLTATSWHSYVGTTPLHLAAASNAIRVLEAMLHRIPSPTSPDVRDKRGFTPLSKAVRAQNSAAVRMLARAGAHVDAPYCVVKSAKYVSSSSNFYGSYLRYAAHSNRPVSVAALLAAGADFRCWYRDGKRAVHIAVEHGALECVKLLLSADLIAWGNLMPVQPAHSDLRKEPQLQHQQQRQRSALVSAFFVRHATAEHEHRERYGDGDNENGDDDDDDDAFVVVAESTHIEHALSEDEEEQQEEEERRVSQQGMSPLYTAVSSNNDAASSVHVSAVTDDDSTLMSITDDDDDDDDDDEHDDNSNSTSRSNLDNDRMPRRDERVREQSHQRIPLVAIPSISVLRLRAQQQQQQHQDAAEDAQQQLADTEEEQERQTRALRRVLRQVASQQPSLSLQSSALNRDRGSSLLHLAASYNQPRVLQYLLDTPEASLWKNAKNEQGKSAIFMAARHGSVECMQLLLQHGFSISDVDLESWTVLNEAVKYNQLETMKFIMENGADVCQGDDDGWTPLHVAGRFGVASAIPLLVAAGAQINAKTEDRETPLLLACSQSGQEQVVAALLEHGADPTLDPRSHLSPVRMLIDRKDFSLLNVILSHLAKQPEETRVRFDALSDDSASLLFACVEENVQSLVENLLVLKVNPDVRDIAGDTPLCVAARADKAGIVRALLEGGADPNYAQGNGYRAVHIASDEGKHEIMQMLVDHNVDVEITVPSPALHEGFTPLMLAARRGHAKVVSVLVKAGAALNIQKGDGYSAIHLSALNGQVDSLQVLLDAGANALLVEENSFAPLHVAVRNHQLDSVRTLLAAGVDPNLQGQSGLTALHFAAYMTNARMIWLLLECGADANARDDDSSVPLHVAAGRERGRVSVQMLLTQGADVRAEDAQGDTALHSAAYRGLYATAKVLLRRGADANARNQLGLTPLHLASANGSENTVEALLRAGADPSATDNNGTTPYQIATRGTKQEARLALWRASGQTINDIAPMSTYDIESPEPSPSASTENMLGERGRTICVVCQLPLRFREEVRRLPCEHIYHVQCIEGWFGGVYLREHHTCPLCQSSILPADFDNLTPPEPTAPP